MISKLLDSIMGKKKKKSEQVVNAEQVPQQTVKEVIRTDVWVSSKDRVGNHYVRNKETEETIYCLTGEKEANNLADKYNTIQYEIA